MGAADPPAGDDVFAVSLRAKARADDELRSSGLRWTIVAPDTSPRTPARGA